MLKVLFAAAAAVTLLSSPALADDASNVSVTLRFAHVNFDDPAQVRAFYAHIQSAARQACFDERDAALMRAPRDWSCVNQVVSQAVGRIGQTQLTALYQDQSPALGPSTRLAGNDQ
jgi:UrcA family protein